MLTGVRMMVGAVALSAASFALPATAAAAAPAAPDTPGLHLSVSTPAGSYLPGASVPVSVVVTNAGPTACALEAAAPGALRVVSGTFDGAPMSPSFATALPVNGSADVVTGNLRPTAPGGTVSFGFDAGGPLGLLAVTPMADDGELLATWPGKARGTYRFQLRYAVPAVAGTGACAGASNVATVEFEIGTPASDPPWWWVAAGIVAVLVLVVGGWLLLRRRGRASGAAATALVVCAGLLAGGLARPRPAEADVTFVNGGGVDADAISKAYRDCLGPIIAFDPGMWAALNGPGTPDVTIGPWPESFWVPSDGGGPKDSVIGWAWQATTHLTLEGPGVNLNPCAALYHELKHAEDQAKGLNSDSICAGSPKYGGGGVFTDEVRATIAENRFRHTHGLLQRRFYDAFPLPADAAGCGPTTPKLNVGRRKCTSSCAVTNGDPHLTTFDGAHYDLQAVGELTAVSATAGDMTIQVRQQPYGDSRTVAVNTAVALDVGATRLGFYLRDGTVVVHRDGAVVPVPIGSTELPGGASLRHTADPYDGDVYDVIWPDASDLTLWAASVWGLIAQIKPAASRAGTLSGLLGNFDGDPADDVTPAGAAPLAQPPTFAGLYPAYADSWRITQGASLFDYATGQDTRTFTDETFPAGPTVAAPTGAAADACDAAGVTDPTALADCELDVTVTGQADFAVAAGDATSTSAPDTTGATTLNASIAAAGAVATLTFTAAAGQRIFVQVVSTTLPGDCGLALALYGPAGDLVGSGCLLPGGDIQSTVSTSGGAYTVVVDPAGAATGTAQIRVSLSRDQTVATAIGGPPTTLTVPVAGGQARATFDAAAGQTIFIAVTDATIADQCDALRLLAPDGDVVDAGCVVTGAGYVDAVALPSAGRYAVLVDPAGGGTGRLTVHILAVSDQTVVATIGGPAVAATIAQPGAVSRVTFDGTAGQKIQIGYDSSTLPPQCGVISLISPEHAELDAGCTTGASGTALTATLAETGEYTVSIDPSAADVGMLDVTISATS